MKNKVIRFFKAGDIVRFKSGSDGRKVLEDETENGLVKIESTEYGSKQMLRHHNELILLKANS